MNVLAEYIVAMIILHSASGVEIDLNAAAITNLRNPEPGPNPSFSANVKCQVNLSDGKFVTVRETCAEVRKIMDARAKAMRSTVPD